MKPHIMRGVRGGIAIAVLRALGWLAGCSDNPAGVASVRSFAAVSAGEIHTCGVTAARDAYCWGHNLYGELGVDPTTTSETCPGAGGPLPCSTVPVRVAGRRSFAAVSAGFLYSCGITAPGVAYCWGNDVEGQLGDGSTSISGTPVAVAGNLRFSSVSTGDYHTCGLTTNGTVYCWGRNDNGELGNGSTTWSSTPVAVAGGLTFSAVSVGYDYSCAVTADGAAYCWGSNLAGRLGNGSTEQLQPGRRRRRLELHCPRDGWRTHLRAHQRRRGLLLGIESRRAARRRLDHEQLQPGRRRRRLELHCPRDGWRTHLRAHQRRRGLLLGK